ncbi:MAG TPA: site-2 protease family protein [Bryobacteraceae bacterium]|jgi:membrane-associated protease RseP (regulator of RpoE activity)|nr:site-2 protease family protein [Bryobacteraceae bacterium]
MPGFLNRRLGASILLFLVTLYTTTLAGTLLSVLFRNNRPLDFDLGLRIVASVWDHPAALVAGLPYSLCLLAILMAHELGHYITCLRYGIDVTPPYFLPGPPVLGTFGAFIWIRSPIYTKRKLFDVGIAGPLAGFAVLLPVLLAGVALSQVSPGIAARGDFIFGTPLALRFVEWIYFPGVPVSDIHLHPVALAAWGGLLATALNLLPIGQLDGGHILYAFFAGQHRWLSRLFIFALIPLGFFARWSGWYFWAVILFFFMQRHPAIFDENKLGAGRVVLGFSALAIFILSFTAAPFS